MIIKLKVYNSDNILTPSSGTPTGEYIILVDKEGPAETLHDGKWEYTNDEWTENNTNNLELNDIQSSDLLRYSEKYTFKWK